jgi:Ca-activated chloride channel family protein
MGGGMFQTSVFPIPPGAERKVTLRYSQLCRHDRGLTDLLLPLSTAKYTNKPLEKLEISVNIESADPIKNVYSPSHPIEIKRPDDKHAVITLTKTNEIPTTDFRLFYDVGREPLRASVLSYRPSDTDEGYFLLLATPDFKSPDGEMPKKNVVFVVDRSGSMSGPKFEQAKGALKFVLNNLREGDLFNIVAYDSAVESYRPEMQKFDEAGRSSALGYVEGLYAGGSTNISGALTTALAQLKDSSRPNYVVFLTDGLPTDGETNEAKIAAMAKAANTVRARMFVLGVGYDVNSRLLDKLSGDNHGQAEYVRPNEDLEARVAALYNRIGSPVLTDVKIEFEFDGVKPEDGSPVSRVYPAETRDLFAGEQLVIAGRYKKFGAAKVKMSGMSGSEAKSWDFPATFVEKSGDESNAFVEKLWATRRVGEIIDELDLKGKNEELVKELVALSLKHGILTPYTAFLADDTTPSQDMATNTRHAADRLERLAETSNKAGVEQRGLKGAYRGAQAAAPRRDARFQVAEEAAADAFGVGSPGIGASSGRARFNYQADSADEKAEQLQIAKNVLQLGSKTFFRRGDKWIDSTLTPEQEKNAQRVERFSDPYFDLVNQYGDTCAKYLTIDEPLLVELGGQVYQVE